MWLLKDKDGKLIYIKPNRTFTVGRREGTLVLPDNSVSRHHAEITVVPRDNIGKIGNNMEPLSNCMIKDLGSKYGNFILKDGSIEMQVTKDGYTFKHMDRVRFGVQDSIYTVMYVPMITATSGLDATQKEELRLTIDTINGKITPGWEAICTHMTVSNPNISEKLTCALAYGTPIVPMEYWKFVTKAFEANKEMPNPLEFVGLIHKKMAMLGEISVLPNPLRRTLFKDLTFVHFDSQQYKLYERMIRIAGGNSLLYRSETHRNLDVCGDNIIVVQLVESNTTQATGTGDAKYALACEKLGRIRRRTIPTGEIALAIYHVSKDKFCNPKHDYAEMFKNRKSDNPPENSTVLAQDTQDVDLPPTTSCHGALKSHTIDMGTKNFGESVPQTDYIKESIEESSSIDPEPTEIARPISVNYLSESSGSSCLYQLGKPAQKKSSLLIRDSQLKSHGSIKVASLNWEKYLEEEFNAKTSINENPMKRNREEDEKIDTTKKKICRDVSIDEQRNEKLSVKNKEADISYECMPDDEDFMFIDEKDSDEDLFKRNQEKPGSRVSQKVIDDGLRKKSVAERDVRATNRERQHKIAPTSTSNSNSAGEYETPRKFQPEDRTSLKHQNEEERSRKRKIGGPEDSPWDVDSPLKRNKATTDDANKTSKVHLKAAIGEKNLKDFANSKKTVETKTKSTLIRKSPKSLGDSEHWLATKMNISTDEGDKSSINHGSSTTGVFKKPSDPDTSMQPLLRIQSPNEATILTLPKFGKKFCKAYKLNPLRIEMDRMIDMHLWSELDNAPKIRTSSDEEPVTPQKVSPNCPQKKALRV